MNLLLVDQLQSEYRFGEDDPRTEAILRLAGPEICLGVVRGPRGIGEFEKQGDGSVVVGKVRWEAAVYESPAVDLVIGLPRPAEARRIIVQAAAMGVRKISLVVLDRTPSGYAQSRSLSAQSIDRLLKEGLEQGFHTALPSVSMVEGIGEALEQIDSSLPASILDPYLGDCLLGEAGDGPDAPGTLVLGSERGFSPREQEIIRNSPVRRRHLGPSILRTETAVVAALGLAHRQSGFFSSADRGVIRPE
tara:strand:+ start:12178 stop:12921 length:744 start_codon:yes stop_codon:yes gene_type:complete